MGITGDIALSGPKKVYPGRLKAWRLYSKEQGMKTRPWRGETDDYPKLRITAGPCLWNRARGHLTLILPAVIGLSGACEQLASDFGSVRV